MKYYDKNNRTHNTIFGAIIGSIRKVPDTSSKSTDDAAEKSYTYVEYGDESTNTTAEEIVAETPVNAPADGNDSSTMENKEPVVYEPPIGQEDMWRSLEEAATDTQTTQ